MKGKGMGQEQRGEWQIWMGIALAMIEDGMTQTELAKKLGWEESKVSRIARGKQKPKGGELYDIAAAQNRDLGWYFHGPVRPETRVTGLERDRVQAILNRPVPLAAA